MMMMMMIMIMITRTMVRMVKQLQMRTKTVATGKITAAKNLYLIPLMQRRKEI